MDWLELARIIVEVILAIFAAKPASKATVTAVRKVAGR